MKITSIFSRYRFPLKFWFLFLRLPAGLTLCLQSLPIQRGVRKWGVLIGALKRAAPLQCSAACSITGMLRVGGTG
jgi:hypothetical protein